MLPAAFYRPLPPAQGFKHRGGDERIFKIENDLSATQVGRSLCRRSPDETRSLSVLRSEMNLAEPRPLIQDEHHRVEATTRRRPYLNSALSALWPAAG